MVAFSTYSTGAVTIAAGATIVTGIGTGWTETDVLSGDLIQIDTDQPIEVSDLTDSTHLTLWAPWAGANKTSAAYKIIKKSPKRFNASQTMIAVSDIVADLESDEYYVRVKSTETVPNPSRGKEDQYALQSSSGKLWVKNGGAWVYLGIYKGLGLPLPWNGATAYNAFDVASVGGSSYVCILAHTNHAPPNATYWTPLASIGPQGIQGIQGVGYGGTSATSLSIGTGSKVFTDVAAGLAYQVGNYIRASSGADGSNFMEGYLAYYVGNTMGVTVVKTGGGGTHADWSFATAGSPGAGDLLSSNHLTDASYLSSGTGAVIRSAPSKFSDVFSVKDFGALGNGSADDTLKIRDAMAEAAALGKSLFFPGGSYVTDVLVPPSGSRLYADKYQTTALVSGSVTADTLDLSNGFITIDGFQMASAVTKTSGTFINVAGPGCKLKGLYLSGPINGIKINATSTSLDDIVISSLQAGGSVGIDVYSGLALNLNNIQVNAAGGYSGLVLRNLGDIKITASRFLGGIHTGLIIPGSGESVIFPQLIACDFDQGTSNALLIAPSGSGTVHLAEFTNCEFYGTNIGVNMSGSGTIDGVTFNQLTTVGNASYGVLATNSGGATLKNINIVNAIISSQSGNLTATGIQFTGVDGGTISCNKVGPTAVWTPLANGIVLNGSTNEVIVENNDVRGNTNLNIADSATGNNRIRNNPGYVNPKNIVSSTVASGAGIPAITAVPMNITSVSLPPGVWDCEGVVGFDQIGASTVLNFALAWISTTSATIPAIPNNGAFYKWGGPPLTGQGPVSNTGTIRLNLSVTTTVYLSADAFFTTSTLNPYGSITCRRVFD